MISAIRKTRPDDLHVVMQIYEAARRFMHSTGNSNQWGEDYPSVDLIKDDMDQGNSFVCLSQADEVVGVFYFQKEKPDPTYLKIHEGDWINDDKYGVIHRIASSGAERGVMDFVVNWCYRQTGNIRIDTHRDNIVMQNILRKTGFRYCGIIYLKNGDERLAYQKV